MPRIGGEIFAEGVEAAGGSTIGILQGIRAYAGVPRTPNKTPTIVVGLDELHTRFQHCAITYINARKNAVTNYED